MASTAPAETGSSPCIAVCRLSPGSQICEGCYRSLGEIGEWRDASAERRSAIVREASRRRADAESR